MRRSWTGCGTALVTPFDRSGGVDEQAVVEQLRAWLQARVALRRPHHDRRGGRAGSQPGRVDHRGDRQQLHGRQRGAGGSHRSGRERARGRPPEREPERRGDQRRGEEGQCAAERVSAAQGEPARDAQLRRRLPRVLAACILMAAVLLMTVFLTRGFFLEGQPHLVRIPALLVILGSGVFTYFTASQFLRAMTLGDLRIMFRRIT